MRKYKLSYLFLTILILRISVSTYSAAASVEILKPVDNVYYPGYIDVGIPLSTFAPARLKPVCDSLIKGDDVTATNSFKEEIDQHPNDFAAYIGYLQSIGHGRDILLKSYKQEAKNNPSAVNTFKLGVLALYLSGENMRSISMQPENNPRDLGQLAVQNLNAAYKHSQLPITGFVLASSYFPLLPAQTTTSEQPLPIYESLLKQMSGKKIYLEYLHARNNHWNASEPDVPNLTKQNLEIFRYIIGGIRANNGIRYTSSSSKMVNGKWQIVTKLSQYTNQQLLAMKFLQTWKDKINKKISAE